MITMTITRSNHCSHAIWIGAGHRSGLLSVSVILGKLNLGLQMSVLKSSYKFFTSQLSDRGQVNRLLWVLVSWRVNEISVDRLIHLHGLAISNLVSVYLLCKWTIQWFNSQDHFIKSSLWPHSLHIHTPHSGFPAVTLIQRVHSYLRAFVHAFPFA